MSNAYHSHRGASEQNYEKGSIRCHYGHACIITLASVRLSLNNKDDSMLSQPVVVFTENTKRDPIVLSWLSAGSSKARKGQDITTAELLLHCYPYKHLKCPYHFTLSIVDALALECYASRATTFLYAKLCLLNWGASAYA